MKDNKSNIKSELKPQLLNNKLNIILMILLFLGNGLYFLANYYNIKDFNEKTNHFILSIFQNEPNEELIINNLLIITNYYKELFKNNINIIIYKNDKIFFKKSIKENHFGFNFVFKKSYIVNQNNIFIIQEYVIPYKEYTYFLIILIFILILLYIFYVKNLKQIILVEQHRQADYYLLNQLIEPFKLFSFQSNYLKIEYYLEQFIKFKYKNHFFEIGGDFIYIENIELRNRKFIFFVNADSMGKSLQGLVGTLVLSSILSAILKRTKKRNLEKERYPETWLKYTSLEIHEVFETFQGFMMISAIIGLIDENNGLLYFLNFDHPKPIYIHNNQYYFLESKIHKKLGFPKINEQFEVYRFPLLQNDLIFIGSDGKDEILVNNKINEDEYFSLNLLKESNTNLNTFIEKLKNGFLIIDDISLIKIQYISIPEYPNIDLEINFSNYKSYFEYTKQILFLLLKNKNYTTIIEAFKEIVDVFPFDDDILYWYSYACRKRKFYLEAVQIGERLLNFNKNHQKNYIQLIYCYTKINHVFRIEALIKEYEKILEKPFPIKYFNKIFNNQKNS